MKNRYSYLILQGNKFFCINSRILRFLFLFCCLCFGTQLFAQQQIQLTGNVIDDSGEPVIGASVMVTGQRVGTVTDIDGNFTLSVPSNGSLSVSFLGYVTQKVEINNQKSITVRLKEDVENLDEVVVIGYGTVKKRDLTGSVASIKSDEITKLPTSNALEAIQGKVPGMDITRSSGAAGSGVNIIIRGTKTIGAIDKDGKKTRDTNPLFIIDGVQGGSYADLNPADIESIDVLKDASSTAIYGSLGANGVVIITTKKGKEGKINVSYSGHYGVNGWVDYPKPRIGKDYLNLRREAYRTVGEWNSPADDANVFDAQEVVAFQNNQWVDWLDLLVRNGYQQNHNVTLSGGNDKMRSFVSLNYFNEEGILKNDNINRYSLRANLDYTVNKWIKAGANMQVTYSENNRVSSSMLTKAMTTVPLGKPYNDDGSINPYPLKQGDISPLSDYANKQNAQNNVISSKIFAAGYLEIQPLKNLKLRSNLSVALDFSREGIYSGFNTQNQSGQNWNNEASATNNNRRFYSWDNIVTYNHSIGDHSFEVTGITTWTKEQNEEFWGRGENQHIDSPGFLNMGMLTSGQMLASSYAQQQTMGFAGRISYNYMSKYLLTLTAREDASSVLPSDHRWNFFPSVSGAWRVSDEMFMESTRNWLSDLKLRLSYGVSGSSSIPPYTAAGGSGKIGNNFGFNDIGAPVFQFDPYQPNLALKWEKSYTTNIGLDLGFLQNRITAGLDFYNTVTKDILFAPLFLPSAGAGGPASEQFKMYQNSCETINRGFELTINSTNIDTKDFRWTSTFTFSTNKNEITSLVGGVNEIIHSGDPQKASLLKGRPIDSFYSYKIDGVWQLGEEAEMAKYKLDGKANQFKPGDLKIRDIDGDFNITADDRTYLGHAEPSWSGGLNNTFYYKGFDLGIYAIMRWGQMIDAQFLGRYDPAGIKNSPAYLSYWTPENPSNVYPRPKKGSQLYDQRGYMSLNYVDGSYFKLKNISLGYTVPRKLTEQWGVSNLKFYVTASNIWTVAKSGLIKHYDPERGGSETEPLAKQLIFGVNLTF